MPADSRQNICISAPPARGFLARAWFSSWWRIGFFIYFFIMSSYFFLLWVGMVLKLKPAVNLEEEPGVFIKNFVAFWNWLPAKIKIWLSRQNKFVYELPITKAFIAPYQYWNYKDIDSYLSRFRPYFGGDEYTCYQDFFARELVDIPKLNSDFVMPCEGLLCDVADFTEERTANVKGDVIGLRDIFGRSKCDIPVKHQFLNVFLSNRDYHHIHAPVSGTIKKMEKIPGNLIVLRPWFYRHHPSIPALINERVNIDIEDEQGRVWFLSIVGGPVVNSILMNNEIRLDSKIQVGQKIAGFELGSTCCMAFPKHSDVKPGSHVTVFQDL